MNARIAKFDLVERELWKRMEEKRQWGVEVGWEERGFVTVAGSSQNGAAMTLTAQTRMRETRRLMQKEAREEILKKREEIKRQEEELGRKEEELRKMEEELQRRAEEIRENERKIRKREEQVRKREEEMGKKGRSNKEERRGGKENKKGFPRFLSRN
jgi:hypothetical protein